MTKRERKQWSQQEDILITRFTALHGTKKWVLCGNHLKSQGFSRIACECRDRWFNHLDPCIQKQPWTVQEQVILLKSIEKYGSRWCQIAKQLPGRTQNSTKNQFYSLLRCTLKLMAKIYKPSSVVIIKFMSPNDLLEIYNYNSCENIIKNLLLQLNFEIYKQTVSKYIKSKQQEMKQFFTFIDKFFEDKKMKEFNNFKDEQPIQNIKQATTQSSDNLMIKEQYNGSVKYFSLATFIPVSIDQSGNLKLCCQDTLVSMIKEQLKTLDANHFLNL